MAGPSAPTRHLGLDLGGTYIKWATVERAALQPTNEKGADDWREVDRGQLPTHGDEGPSAVIERLASIARDACEREAAAGGPPLTSIGIGVPGLYDPPSGTTRWLVNLPGDWAGLPVTQLVGSAAGLPAYLINDARAFGLAELRLGAGRGAGSMIGLTLGTGVGGVVAVDGRVHQGHSGTAGELGHQTLDPEGPQCGCGNRGCLEAYARADRIAEACDTPSAAEAFERARAGDARARAGMAHVGRYLGLGIANMIVALTPDRVVLGGGNAAGADLLLPHIRAELERRVRVTTLDDVAIVTAELGTWAGAIGAAIHGAESMAG